MKTISTLTLTLICLILIIMISCDRYGDSIHAHGTRLVSIYYQYDARSWEEFFDYDSLGRLIRHSSMGLYNSIYTMEYENDQVKFIHRIDPEDGHEIQKDSIVYTPSGQTHQSFEMYDKKLVTT